jgi:hypothetical protein
MSRQEPPPALRGGSRGYEPATRICALALQQTGFSHLAVPAVSSINRWARDGTARQPQTGGVVRYTLVGEHLFLLAVCRLLYPKCQADEVACFIAQNSANPIFYSRQQITERERELGLTRKKGSTTAWQALTAYNIKRRQLFWTFAYPIGVFGISRHDLIDIDEAGLWLEKKNPTFGKALSSVRVRAPGVYGHGEKWTLILAINCAGFRYIRFEKVGLGYWDSHDNRVRSFVYFCLRVVSGRGYHRGNIPRLRHGCCRRSPPARCFEFQAVHDHARQPWGA